MKHLAFIPLLFAGCIVQQPVASTDTIDLHAVSVPASMPIVHATFTPRPLPSAVTEPASLPQDDDDDLDSRSEIGGGQLSPADEPETSSSPLEPLCSQRVFIFTAEGCPPCPGTKENLYRVAERFGLTEDDIEVVVLQDDYDDLFTQHEIEVTPTVMAIRDDGLKFRAYPNTSSVLSEGSIESVLRSAGVGNLQSTNPVSRATNQIVAHERATSGPAWTYPGQQSGNARTELIRHLTEHPNHAARFTSGNISGMSLEQLEQLHTDDHNQSSGRYTTTQSRNVDSPVMRPVYRSVSTCPTGTCQTDDAQDSPH